MGPVVHRNHGKDYLYYKIARESIYIAPVGEPGKVNIANLLRVLDLMNQRAESQLEGYQKDREELLPYLRFLVKKG